MDALTFLTKHGRDKTREVCDHAETSIEYFSQIAYGHRRPSVDLAKKLVKASEDLIPVKKHRLDLVSLLQLQKVA
jgi:hypothetical protein